MRRLPLRSPPRMRGKGIADDEARAAVGITPACAGKSELPRFFSDVPGITPAYAGKRGMAAAQRLLNQDHPRVCGEKCC